MPGASFDYMPPIGVGSAKRAASPKVRAWRLAVLMFLGLICLAAVQSYRLEGRDECGPFTIGRSAIGGCDWIGPMFSFA